MSPGDKSMDDSSFRVLGVCGGIGSGKSTACKLLVDSINSPGSKIKCYHIDADKVAHSVYAPGSQAVRDVVNEFGQEILVDAANDGSAKDPLMEIDRKKLGAIVFADNSAMAELEKIVWPHVKDKLNEQIENFRVQWKLNSEKTETMANTVVVLEAAILLDAGWDDLLDGVWAVTVPRERALARLVETRGLTEEEATKRLLAQEPRRGIGNLEKEVGTGIVNCVINNNGSLDDLKDTLEKSLEDPNCWKPLQRWYPYAL